MLHPPILQADQYEFESLSRHVGAIEPPDGEGWLLIQITAGSRGFSVYHWARRCDGYGYRDAAVTVAEEEDPPCDHPWHGELLSIHVRKVKNCPSCGMRRAPCRDSWHDTSTRLHPCSTCGEKP